MWVGFVVIHPFAFSSGPSFFPPLNAILDSSCADYRDSLRVDLTGTGEAPLLSSRLPPHTILPLPLLNMPHLHHVCPFRPTLPSFPFFSCLCAFHPLLLYMPLSLGNLISFCAAAFCVHVWSVDVKIRPFAAFSNGACLRLWNVESATPEGQMAKEVAG
jgi:hypothetical protein